VAQLRHRKFIITIVIVLLAVGGLLALAQAQVTLKIKSAHGADDPQFPSAGDVWILGELFKVVKGPTSAGVQSPAVFGRMEGG